MIERTLNRVGLNEYERKVYLHLVKHGTLGAVELAKKSGVPFGRIYDVLYQLESKGFVKVVIGKPKKFAPIEPKVALDSAIKKLKETYGDKLEVRCFSEEVGGTMRNFVFGKEIAVNGIKILPETSTEPSYIGTAYVNLQDIEVLDDKFNSLWGIAKPLKKTTTEKEC